MKFLLLWILIVCASYGIAARGLINWSSGKPNPALMRLTYDNKSSNYKTTSKSITNHGGPIIKDPVAYTIFYGNWTSDAVSIVNDFVGNIGSSDWWKINQDYGVNELKYGGQAFDENYSQGKSFNQPPSVFNVVKNAIDNGLLPNDDNGIYLVLSSSDVTNNNFCTVYCGYHTFDSATKLKFAYIGVPSSRTCRSCQNQSRFPNRNPGVDSMVGTIAHELAEAATSPLLSAWYDENGDENADKCVSKHLNYETLPWGARYNVVFGPRKFYIQSNWNLNLGRCSLSRDS